MWRYKYGLSTVKMAGSGRGQRGGSGEELFMEERTEKLFGKGKAKISIYAEPEFKDALEGLAEKSRYRSLNHYCLHLMIAGLKMEPEYQKLPAA